MDTFNEVKVIRAPSLKRGKTDEKLSDRIKLKKVLGLTVCSNAALDVSPSTGVLAYPAGCTVVLFNLKKLSQSYLLNTSRKAITAVAYSRCGRYIATGECGLNPTIKVWELDQQNGNFESAAGTIVAEFSGHKYAVNCVAFSPTGKYLVSVGSQHDMIVNVFDWRSNLKIASNKVSAKVVAVSFSEDGNYFVTVGNRHVKYWYLDGGRKYKEPQPIPLMGRSAILGELRNNDFCAVACGKGDKSDSTYAITRNGQLVEFNSRRLLDKWVACRTTSANCICVSGKFILVGCAESIIRCFNAENLEYITTLPRTHYLGVDVSQGVHISHMMSAPNNAKYPDTIAIVFDEQRSKVSCVYNDHSLYIWDLRDIRRIGKSHSFLYHSACIWGVESVPFNYIKTNLSSNLPSDCFLTCSSDDTIRVWGLDGCDVTDIYRKNVYSKDLLKIIYIDNQLNFIKDMDNPILTNEKSSTYDGRNGVRCIKITPDRGHLATGDRSGNIRIYNLTNSKLVTTIEAHDSEVLCLEYTNDKIDKRLLASASRDRLIHIFDCLQGYCILQTLDDHSSSITSVRFIGAGINFQLVSCGADKSIIFRNYQNNQFLRGNNCSGKNTLYDMEVDSNSKHILTACQDRNIRVYGTQNAKHTKTFKGSHSDEGSLIKLSLDLSGIYIATSCTDKTLSVYDYYSNECMARMYGHSELVTGLKFTNDCKHLISASGDGCVFIWQVPHDMIVTMQARLSQQAIRSGHQIQRPLSQPIGDILIEQNNHHNHDKFGSPPNNFIEEQPVSPGGYKFSDVGQLPQWAKRKTSDETQGTHVLSTSPSQTQFENNQKARGRWAQKTQFEPDTMYMKNIMDNPITIPFNNITANNINNINNNNNNNSSDYHSSSSKDVYNNQYLSEDSSIDSGMENRRDIFLSKTLEQKNMNSLNSESNTEHDGDVEDISDGERTSSDHGLVFYPAVSPGTPTNFKVNEINVEELRKSMRRTKLEKLGLVLSPTNQSAPSTGSDDEDEGSTPSGDNADRSLASTLGGSSESIPQQSSSSFLQAALDGPGSLSDKDHRGRKSLSTLHNKDGNVITSISKSFTNSKKEELMKVINEAKQKLENGHISHNHKKDVRKLKTIREVGYRSNLRTSQSISDLSHSANMDMNYRTSRGPGRTGEKNSYFQSNYLNCAAPKSILAHNCNMIRQIQRDYPPYPLDIGNYNNSTTTITNNTTNIIKSRPNTLELPLKISPYDLQQYSTTVKLKKHPGILKNYKSCPVSPVHEELEWCTLPPLQTTNNSQSTEPKRHSLYSDDAKTILDMIHTDTEKMIAEITSKYGDLDEYKSVIDDNDDDDDCKVPKINIDCKNNKTINNAAGGSGNGSGSGGIVNKTIEQLKYTAQKEKNEHGFLSEEDGNFSSDSLEDCSIDLELNNKKTNKPKRTICKKHNKIEHQKLEQNQLPKRSVSDYYIFEDFSTNQFRKVSLSDILNDDALTKDENHFLETQRHSSASFFLGQQYPECKSQESILSDDYSGGGVSYCNSMESILSDESECKSAPLEILFGRSGGGCCSRKDNVHQRYSINNHYDIMKNDHHQNASKSYGSSPNATCGFDYFMENQQHQHNNFDRDYYDIPKLGDYRINQRVFENKSPIGFQTQHEIQKPLTNSFTYPRLSSAILQEIRPNNINHNNNHSNNHSNKNSNKINSNNKIEIKNDDEFIPSSTIKNAQYNCTVNKSLSKEFANQRQQNNTNPLLSCDGNELFVRKIIDKQQRPSTSKLSSIQRSDIFQIDTSAMKKSLSFEIKLDDDNCGDFGDLIMDNHNHHRTPKSLKRFEENLEKFNRERKSAEQKQQQQQQHHQQQRSFGGTLEMDYVPHKPPVANRRSSSMRSKNKPKLKEKYNTVGQFNFVKQTQPQMSRDVRDFVNKEYNHNYKNNDGGGGSGGGERSFDLYVAEKGICEDDNMDSLEVITNKNLLKENSIDSLDDIPLKYQDLPRSITYDNLIVNRNLLLSVEYTKFRDIEKKIDVINKLVELEEKKLENERIVKEERMRPFNCDLTQKGYVKNLTKNFDKLARTAQLEHTNEQITRNNNITTMKRNYSLPDVLEGAKMKTFEFTDDDLYKVEHDHDDDDVDDDDGHHHTSLGRRHLQGGIHAKSLMSAHDDDSSIIRRACSLSDLSMGKGFKTTTTQLTTTTSSSSSSNYKPTPNNRQNVPVRIQAKRNSLTSKLSVSGMGMRSVSVGMLNQASDSEPEHTRGGILRPTISSQNKTNGTTGSSGGGGGGGSGGGGSGSSGGSTQRQYSAVKNSAGIINRRRGLQNSHSSVNLSMVGHDDSSSEETTTPINLPTKPAVPPRPRSISVDHKRFNNINNINNINNNNNVNNSITIKNRSNNNINNNNNNFDISQMDLPCKDTDITSVDVTSQLCSNIINNLMQTTNSVMQLHKRLQHTTEVDQPTTVIGGSRNNNLMLKELENAVIMTQNMLTKITIKNDCNDGQNINYLTNNIHNNTTNTTLLSSSSSMTQLMGSSTTQTQTTTTTAENGDYLQMMDRCSDILNKVHKQM